MGGAPALNLIIIQKVAVFKWERKKMRNDYTSLFGKNPNNLLCVKECGNVLEITYTDRRNNTQHIQKLDAYSYLNLHDGTINDFEKKSTRADNIDSVKKSIKVLRDLINTNTTQPQNVLFITLTYAENMTDRKRLMHDYEVFYKRFKRYCIKQYNYLPKYICVPEPQERGAWHCHVLMIFQNKPKFIKNDLLAKMWGHGFVSIKSCDNIDNIGAYLSAYLANTESKKGGRLPLYPVGMHLYRCSADIVRPSICYKSVTDVNKILNDYKLTYWCSYVTSDNDSFGNRIEKRFFRKLNLDDKYKALYPYEI